MTQESIFRIGLLLLIVAFVAHRGYYTRKFGQNASTEAGAQPPGPATSAANLLALIGLLSTALAVFLPRWMDWAALPLPVWLRWTGFAIAALGFALLQWAHNSLGRNWSDAPQLLAGQRLVVNGPYRWVRHPIYTAFLLILGSTLLISANWCVGAAWIGMTALQVAQRIQFEEGLMIDNFGDAYRAYMQRTARLLPRLKTPGS